ncbi:MAG: FAD-dependent oxidoreductase, partial [Myxococcota bacterium]|nr:FAD-dependent oxidoreductase [Myxococcota bacterium]
EVIHAGLYYPPASLKAEACIEGRELVYERCARQEIPHREIGKWIVAVEEAERSALEAIAAQAEAAGAGSLGWLDAAAIRRREPQLRAIAALESPRTGIVDALALLGSYQAEFEARGGTLVCNTRVVGFERAGRGWRVEALAAAGERVDCVAGAVVNAAGLEADRIAEGCGIDIEAAGWRQRACRGDYFAVEGPSAAPVQRLIYPLPSDGGLGIHVSLDLAGRARFGPDVEYVVRSEAGELANAAPPGAEKAVEFAGAVARYLPSLAGASLVYEMSGFRARLGAPGEGFRDFVLASGGDFGAPGTFHLIGIESPGLTASPALARRVADAIA